ncbi:MAG: hypothetical protein JAY91_11150 [Candidatus Thiodiazotropha endolucinida]|nr:hypothetical protein [Candidatus Thiodiazotropha taylori]MCW4241439.1 hypothetical protein [Candidatus Thiodiazotropha taylori]
MSTPNLYTNSAPAQSYTAVISGMDSAQQSEGKTLLQQASQSHQPDVLIKRQFEQRNQTQRSKLANEFIASAGREGISQLAATPDGQHALAVVYDHADSDGRGLMRQMHEEQGSTAVDYTGNRNENPSGESADPLSVSDAGVDIGPRPTPLQYAALTSGVGYGLAENTVKGLLQIGEAVAKESPELKNVDNLEYAGIDEYQSKSREPGLTLPDWADVGNALKGHVQATNEALKAAKDKGEYFEVGKAMSNDPMLQMTGLGDMAVFGAMARTVKAAKLDSLVSGNAKINTGEGSTNQISDGKFTRAQSSDSVSSVGENGTVQAELHVPEAEWTHLTLSERHFPSRVSIPKKSGNTMLIVSPKEAAADLSEIHKLGDEIRTGENFTVSSGRVYGVHNDSIYPVRGPGTVDITSSEYNILLTARKKGLEKAQMSLDMMANKGIFSQEQYDRTKMLLELINRKGD